MPNSRATATTPTRRSGCNPPLVGDVILGATLQEPGNDDPTHPRPRPTSASAAGRSTVRSTACRPRTFAARAARAGATGVGVGVFLVDPQGDGVTLTRATATSGEPLFHVTLQGARGEAVGDPAVAVAPIAADVVAHTIAGLCVIQVASASATLQMTAEHVRTRAVRAGPRHVSGGVATRRPTRSSTPRRSGSPHGRPRGGSARGSPPPTRLRSRSSGLPTAAARRPRRPAPARRRGCRRRLPFAPLLHVGQGRRAARSGRRRRQLLQLGARLAQSG